MTDRLRLITWNINSLRLRMPLLGRVVEETRPDVVCLQETKVDDANFPLEAVQALGFAHVSFRGDKGYNGVAILSKRPIEPAGHRFWGGVEDARHISARLPDGMVVHNFYVPAGGDVPDPEVNPKFAHKLRFLDDLAAWGPEIAGSTAPRIMVGDLNIAPLETDVWSHKQLLKVVSHTPVEVEKLDAVQAAGAWVDVVRQVIPPEQKLYSWWSYRARDWAAADRGRRLDHIWTDATLAPRVRGALVLKEARGWEQPSDHVPVMVDIDPA